MMSIEDLNKTQLILLTLLVSFVTSIATGIITTSLLEEAPVSITQTINRVVERTIETVTPATGSKVVSLSKEDKELLGAVDRAAAVSVRLEEVSVGGSATSTTGLIGVIVSSDGLVVTSSKNISEDKSYVAILPSGARLPLSLTTSSKDDNLAIFQIVTSASNNEVEGGQ